MDISYINGPNINTPYICRWTKLIWTIHRYTILSAQYIDTPYKNGSYIDRPSIDGPYIDASPPPKLNVIVHITQKFNIKMALTFIFGIFYGTYMEHLCMGHLCMGHVLSIYL